MEEQTFPGFAFPEIQVVAHAGFSLCGFWFIAGRRLPYRPIEPRAGEAG
jgi:hypothetical protein